MVTKTEMLSALEKESGKPSRVVTEKVKKQKFPFGEEHSIKTIGPEEMLRRLEEQQRINLAKLEKQYGEAIGELPSGLSEEEKLKKEEEYIIEREKREFLKKRKGLTHTQIKKEVNEEIGLLQNISTKLEGIKKAGIKTRIYEDRNVTERLKKAKKLAELSGDPELREAVDKLNKEISVSMSTAFYETGQMSPTQEKMFEAGQKMLSLPSIQEVEQQEAILSNVLAEQKQREAELEEKVALLEEQAKTEKGAERVKAMQDIRRFAKESQEELLAEKGLSKHKLSKMKEDLQAITEWKSKGSLPTEMPRVKSLKKIRPKRVRW